MSRTRLVTFWNKKAAVIAPVNPWLLRHLLTRGEVLGLDEANSTATSPRRAMLTAPPSSGPDMKANPATISGFVVFRQSSYAGDDHTKAVMALAEHLSRRLGPWEATRLFTVPAQPTAWDAWREETQLPSDELDFLIDRAQIALGPPLMESSALKQRRAIDGVIAEEFLKLWNGESPRKIAESIAERVDGIRATLARPAPLP